MIRRVAHTFTALLAAAFLATSSIVSAHRMAPDRAAMERQAALLALGVSCAEICGMVEEGHEHRCPSCHELPDAPRAAAADAERRVAQAIEDRSGRDLVHGPQHILAHVFVSVPPRIV